MSVRPAGSERAHSPIPEAPEGRRTYVIDTSVLLSDPHALLNFAEHEVVVPIVVITELEGKRCLLYTSPSPRDVEESRMPSSA